ncbi:MAG TPA: FtsQ-type POTRA domain-containing protein [Acidobacteriaceae bacterium]|nr:FtsQ-type POTRA domain-containing protein [Acidobacteriaceae bacterium]
MAKTIANSGGATLLDEPRTGFYRPGNGPDADARTARAPRGAAEADADEGETFLRARRRVPVRQGMLPPWARTRWGKIVVVAGSATALGAGLALAIMTRNFLDHDPRFRIDSASSIQTVGNSELSRYDLLSVFGSDIGRNVFFVPLAQRRAELEHFPWVQRATVMRVLPNQLRVSVTERTPIAFVNVGGKIALADGEGVILEMTPQEIAAKHYSFPVVSGINPGDPQSVRSARMQIYQKFIGDLDAGGEKVSAQLSEVNLTDPEDVRAMVPAGGSDVELQFGQENFLARWRNYATHIVQWRGQYPKLAAVDLRYEHEVVLKMAHDAAGAAPATPAKPAVADSGAIRGKTDARDAAPTKLARKDRLPDKARSQRRGRPQGLKPKSSLAAHGGAHAVPLQSHAAGHP